MHYSDIPPGHSHVPMGFLGAGELTDTCTKLSQCISSQSNGPVLSDSAYQLVSPHHDALLKTLAPGYSYPRLSSRLLHLTSSSSYLGFLHEAPDSTPRAQALISSPKFSIIIPTQFHDLRNRGLTFSSASGRKSSQRSNLASRIDP